tara:strand:+ start:1482 stop:2189 length:708 start_codon:yes stop_codon:yes gene_type:complete
MAESFKNRIDALTGFAEINGTASDDAISDWLSDGLKQIVSVLPANKLEECAKTSSVTSSSGFDLDTAAYGSILSVTRKDTSGIEQVCRKIPKFLSSKASDPNDLMFSSITDPVYYMDDSIIKILPVPTSTQSANVTYVNLTAVAHGDTSGIANFPDEIENVIVLYASIKAAQSLLASEEDDELYIPMINTLKQDYIQALSLLGVETGKVRQPSVDNNKSVNRAINEMIENQAGQE